MKKALVILLALILLVSVSACGGKAQDPQTEAPAQSGTEAPKTETPAKGDAEPAGFPKEAGYYDPDFDYTQYDKYKVGFLSMTAGELWDAYDIAYEHWAERMNIDYTNIWAPTQYSAEEFISGMQTYIDQGYDGLILEAGVQNYPRVAEILEKSGIPWVSGLAGARSVDGALLHPQIGFDDHDVGVKIVDKLVEWKDANWPDVPWEKVGLVCLDFSYNTQIHNRVLGMEDRWAQLHPEFGAFDPAPDVNPKNLLIGDIGTATNPDQTAAQNLTTQFLSNPGDIEVFLVATPADLYSVGAANAADILGMTDKVCTACHGGVAMPSRWDSGIEDAYVIEEMIAPNACPNGPITTVYGVTYVGSKDLFNGAMPKPGQIILDDITKWRDVIKNPDTSGRDWERYYKAQTDNFDRENKYVKAHGGDYFLTLVSFMGFEGALIAMYEEPEEVYALFDYVSKHYLNVMEQQLRYVRPDIYTIMDDDAAALAPFFSLETYRKLVRPFHEMHAKLALEHGVLLDRHDCGHCDIFVDDWVQMGVRSWNPAQISNDLVGIKKKYGSGLVLCGCWDNTGFFGSTRVAPEVLRAELVKYVDTFAPGGGFVYSPSAMGDPADPLVQERNAIIRDVYYNYARDYYKTH